MNRFLLFAALLLLISAPRLYADSITDPHVGLDDPSCSDGCPVPGPTQVNGAFGTSFTFNADGSNAASPGGGVSFFQTANTINTLDIETFDPAITSSSQVDCVSNVFVCTVTILGGVTDMFFQEDAPIPAGNEFSINLNINAGSPTFCDPFTDTNRCSSTGAQGWIPGEPYLASPNINQPTAPLISTTPEPSTIFLLGPGLLGLLALALKRKRFGNFITSV